jgi:CHAT domain-containing protein
MMRGLGRTFLYAGVTAFVGYLVPVPDESATKFAVSFYEALAQGQTIGESVRRARILCRSCNGENDLTWSSAVLYGDPAARAIDAVSPTTP